MQIFIRAKKMDTSIQQIFINLTDTLLSTCTWVGNKLLNEKGQIPCYYELL